MKKETLQSLRDMFEFQKDETSDNPRLKEGFYSFKLDCIKSTNVGYNKLSDIMMNSGVDEDSRYSWMVGILDDMIDNIDFQALEDGSFELDIYNDHLVEYASSDTPIYNSDLTEWLSKGTNWEFVDDAITEFGCNGGVIQLIQLGYSKGLEEMYYQVVSAFEGGEFDE